MLNVQKSINPETEFAPEWQIPFYTSIYENQKDLDNIKSWIIENEKEIILKYGDKSRGDGGTGLGEKSLTAQYNNFNLFLETENIPEFSRLLDFIREQYKNFISEYQVDPRPCYMWCWANVLRTGQKVDFHNHGSTQYAYLSGNIHLDDYETETKYYHPIERFTYNFPNVKGKLTMFPSYIFHDTDIYEQEEPRVSIAFDLLDMRHSENFEKNRIVL